MYGGGAEGHVFDDLWALDTDGHGMLTLEKSAATHAVAVDEEAAAVEAAALELSDAATVLVTAAASVASDTATEKTRLTEAAVTVRETAEASTSIAAAKALTSPITVALS